MHWTLWNTRPCASVLGGAVLTNDHELGGLKQDLYFLTVLEARSPELVSLGRSHAVGRTVPSLWGTGGGSFWPFQAPGDCQRPSACHRPLHNSPSPVFTWPPLCVCQSPLCLPLLRRHVIGGPPGYCRLVPPNSEPCEDSFYLCLLPHKVARSWAAGLGQACLRVH